MEDTEPYVQLLFHGSYWETDMGSQDPVGVGFCVTFRQLFTHQTIMYEKMSILCGGNKK